MGLRSLGVWSYFDLTFDLIQILAQSNNLVLLGLVVGALAFDTCHQHYRRLLQSNNQSTPNKLM